MCCLCFVFVCVVILCVCIMCVVVVCFLCVRSCMYTFMYIYMYVCVSVRVRCIRALFLFHVRFVCDVVVACSLPLMCVVLLVF